MLISEAISAAAALTGQVVSNATLVRWLSELDGRLAFEFYRADAWTPYDPTDDLSCELLVPFPWDGMYVHHLAAQTYFTNGEYDRYENERVMSEKTLADFRSFMQRTQSRLCGCGFPTEKSGGSGVTVIPGDECHSPWFWLSAYALAVKHGYKGTEEEWVDEQREYVDASLAAKNAAETARDLAYGYSGNAAERAAAAAISAGSASEAAINAATSATSASGSATSAANSVTAAAGYARDAEVSAAAAAASAAAAQVDASKASDVYLEYYGADDPDTTDPSDADHEIYNIFRGSNRKHSVYCMVQQVNEPVLFLRYSGADYEQIEFDYSRWVHHFTQVIDGKLYDLTLTAPAMPISAFTPYWGSLTVTELADLDSPTFTGTPKAPTAAAGTNTTQIATTAFVQATLDGKQDALSFDNQPKENSQKMVKSGGIWQADHKRARIVDHGGNVGLIADAYGDGSAVFCRYTKNGNDYLLPLVKAIEYGTTTDGSKTYTFLGFDPNANLRYQTTAQQTVSQGVISTSWTVVYEIDTIGSPPGTNGTYHLSATRTNDGVTYSWVADT